MSEKCVSSSLDGMVGDVGSSERAASCAGTEGCFSEFESAMLGFCEMEVLG